MNVLHRRWGHPGYSGRPNLNAAGLKLPLGKRDVHQGISVEVPCPLAGLGCGEDVQGVLAVFQANAAIRLKDVGSRSGLGFDVLAPDLIRVRRHHVEPLLQGRQMVHIAVLLSSKAYSLDAIGIINSHGFPVAGILQTLRVVCRGPLVGDDILLPFSLLHDFLGHAICENMEVIPNPDLRNR